MVMAVKLGMVAVSSREADSSRNHEGRVNEAIKLNFNVCLVSQ